MSRVWVRHWDLLLMRLWGIASGITEKLVYHSIVLLTCVLKRLISKALDLVDGHGIPLSEFLSSVIDSRLYLI